MNDVNIEFKGRKAIVTGSTAGIGRATAEGLARAGASVVINGRGSARVDQAVRQMRETFPASDITGIAADLSTTEGGEVVFARAPDADILVNNVGTAHLRDYNGIESIAKIPDEDWLGLFGLGPLARVTRAAMIEALASDYIRTARAAGLSRRKIVWSYGFRNAVLPVLNTSSVVFSYMLGASVLVEKVFGWPGVGAYAIDAVLASDFAPVQGFVIVIAMAMLYLAMNLVIDVIAGLLDPTVRFNV